MLRPNLAREPFLDTRPVWIAGAVLLATALVLTVFSVAEMAGVHSREQTMASQRTELERQRNALIAEVEAANRTLMRVEWRRLALEASALDRIVVQRLLVWSDLLADLERLLPWDVRLVNIMPSVSDKGEVQVVLHGLAAGRGSWLTLLQRFFTDQRFSDPLPTSEESPSVNNPQGYRFQLKVRYWPGGRP